ncbi:MAG: hypothetical protein KDC85_01040 [Saprospiraceae bacterium]|nr:hypothetical protein [Saprospiraceae bacterium]MCB9326865.1 hypothetical protein [Lewinellaceae bacterium]
MIAKRILGMILLAGMGYMGYLKLEDTLYNLHDDAPFFLFIILLLALGVFFAVRRILTN